MPAGQTWRRRLKVRLLHFLVGCSKPIVLLFLGSLATVPASFAFKFAKVIGRCYHAGRRDEVISRLRLFFGSHSLSPTRATGVWRSHLHHVGLTIIEMARFYGMRHDELTDRITLNGEEHLESARGAGRGVILFLNHLGDPGAIAAGIGLRGYHLTIAGNGMDIMLGDVTVPLGFIEKLLTRMLASWNVQRCLLGQNLPRVLKETLQRNGMFGMFIDFPVVVKHNYSLPFGEALSKVNLGPALLALRQRADILCVQSLRIGDNRHLLKISPLEVDHSACDRHEAAAELLQRALQPLQVEVTRHPDQWWPWSWAPLAPRVA